MTEYLPEPVPRCDKHGPMTLRPLAEQSKETAWCGAWYDCRFVEHGHTCGRTTLIQSKELLAQLEEQRAARAAREAAGTNMRADRRVMERLRARCAESARAAAWRMIADTYEED